MAASASDSACDDAEASASRSHFNSVLGRLTETWTHLCSILNAVEMPEITRYNLGEVNVKTKEHRTVGMDLS